MRRHRTLIIAAHAVLGMLIAGTIWIGCAARLVADGGPTIAMVAPFSARAAACPDCARLVAPRATLQLQPRLARRGAWGLQRR